MNRFCLAAAAGLVCISVQATALLAQDTRTVTEPVVPAVCLALKAQLTATRDLDPADEQRLDTERIQKGIDGCVPGQALELAPDGAHNAFLSGPLKLKTGVTLLIDKGVTLFGSRNPRDYDLYPGGCGINSLKLGCKALITGESVSNAAVMGEGTIDGRGGDKMLVDGKPAGKTWWDLSEDARSGGHQQCPRIMLLDHSDNFTLYKITLKNAGFFHVVYNNGNGFTVWGVSIDTPRTARNTDGIDPGASSNITITHSYIRDGDDDVALKASNGPVTNMSVVHNHFYWGHGMSIGSGTTAGVSKLLVQDLSLDGTDAGIRIKSQQAYGGLVRDVLYDNVCIRNSREPIEMDTDYQANPQPGQGLIPLYTDIVLRNVRVSGGGRIDLKGFDHTHRIGVQFDGVELLGGLNEYKFAITHTDILLGPGPVDFPLSGSDSTARGKAGKGKLSSCKDMFVPFPQ